MKNLIKYIIFCLLINLNLSAQSLTLYNIDATKFPTIKASYIIRDTIKVIGTLEVKSTSYSIYYEDLSNPKSVITGNKINIPKPMG
jgi:hypothetical protein